jgi:hypothetical protein
MGRYDFRLYAPCEKRLRRKGNDMKTKSKLTLVVALISALAFSSVRAADLTPAETKAIAEEGFIYGLPIVMNYAVMYEYAVDKGNPQYTPNTRHPSTRSKTKRASILTRTRQ